MRRTKESASKREATFGRTAGATHAKNVRDKPMRGGIRL